MELPPRIPVAGATDRFAGADLSGNFDGGDSSVAITSGSADIDGDGAADFSVGRGIIVSDGSSVEDSAIEGVKTVTFQGSTGLA